MEVLLQAMVKNVGIRRDLCKQGHRRAKLHVVRILENIFDGAAVNGAYKARTFFQPRPENGMLQICLGFITGRNGKLFRHRAPAQTPDLGENKPYPVGELYFVSQFPAYILEDRLLRIQEALQIVWVLQKIRFRQVQNLLAPTFNGVTGVFPM